MPTTMTSKDCTRRSFGGVRHVSEREICGSNHGLSSRAATTHSRPMRFPRFFFGLCTLLVSLVFLPNARSVEPLLEKIDLFQAGNDGVALFRIPGIVVTGKGTVLAYCEARRTSGADWGEIEVHLRRS